MRAGSPPLDWPVMSAREAAADRPLIDQVRSPEDLRSLSRAQLDVLAAEIRDFLVAKVSRTGGHLGPNLGVVELTLALHRVFDSPKDRILFDTGHQAYVHKIVTGRQDGFARVYLGRQEKTDDVELGGRDRAKCKC